MSPSPKKDLQTVPADGQAIQKLIDGVTMQRSVTHLDDRGRLCEIFSAHRPPHPAPLVYGYQFTIRPGKVKGWHVHHLHDDRIFISQGQVKVVLYDSRTELAVVLQTELGECVGSATVSYRHLIALELPDGLPNRLGARNKVFTSSVNNVILAPNCSVGEVESAGVVAGRLRLLRWTTTSIPGNDAGR